MERKIKKIALMAVGDDGWQGGIQYISNIMSSLNTVSDKNPLEVHLFRHSEQNFSGLDKLKNLTIVEHNTEEVYGGWSIENRIKWFLQRKFSKRLNARVENYLLKLDVDYIFPANLSTVGGKLNVGSWIADFQYYHYPDGAREDIVNDAKKVISRIAGQSEKIILSSKFCEADCLKIFPQTKGKTHVMPFAVAINKEDLAFNAFGDLAKQYALPERFLLVANLFAPTKNHKTLFEALGILRSRGIFIDLVCTGNIVDYRNESYANEILQMLTRYKIRSQVHLLGLIPRAHQLAVFRMAVAMVQPSVNEGWSTSVEEAKALGKIILLSDIEVHYEQFPENPDFFEALNAEQLASKIQDIWIRTKDCTFPQLQIEAKAQEQYLQKVVEFGNKFLDIARV